MSGDATAIPECEVTLIIPPSMCAAMGRVESELICLPGKALTWDASKGLRFVVHAVSAVIHGDSRSNCTWHWSLCLNIWLYRRKLILNQTMNVISQR